MKLITRIFDLPTYQLENTPLEKAFNTKKKGKWISTSTKEYIRQYNLLSKGLLELGINKNDKIAVISSNNRTEWNILDMAILQIGAQNVPIYPTISTKDYEYILNHSECAICFVSDKEIFEKVNTIKNNTSIKKIISFDEIDAVQNWKELLITGEKNDHTELLEQRKNSVLPTDLATIIYTSGTTGKPKGVMLSHQNLISNTLNCVSRLPKSDGNTKALSLLPSCHVFERMILYLYQYAGIQIYFAESIETFSDNLKEIQPNIMTAVPRLFEKVFDKIYAKGSELKHLKKTLFFWAVNIGLKYDSYTDQGWCYNLQLSIARKLIFSKWKQALGGNIDIFVSGGAALQTRITRVFSAAEMPILEGYGLTETSPVLAVNDILNKAFKIGTVGKPLANVDIKIAEDGEILAKGDNIMLGYYKDPEKTKEVMSNDYFHTGDIGHIDNDGFLKITDRKKQMFKTSGGKYIAPTLLEINLKQSRFIEQVMVIGEGEKMPAALIQLNFEYAKNWAKIKRISNINSNEDLINSPMVIKRVQQEVTERNSKFGHWEQIKRFQLTPNEWTVENEHLTPTMKVKRKVVLEKHKDLYNKIYHKN